MAQFTDHIFDYVITVCDNAKDSCPVFPGKAKFIHWSIKDPTALAGEEERLDFFRKVRDEIKEKIKDFLRSISKGSGQLS